MKTEIGFGDPDIGRYRGAFVSLQIPQSLFVFSRTQKMGKSPAFQLYAADFYMDTSGWTNEEIGIYLRLLLTEWINGPLPNDHTKLAKIAQISQKKFKNSFKIISKKFIQDGNGNLFNKRLEDEREKQRKYRDAKQSSGIKGAVAKWGNVPENSKTRSERLSAARARGTHTKEEFQEMVSFFSGMCVKCGDNSGGVFRDHIVPIYKGGSDSIKNLQPLCRRCNTGKGPESIDYRVFYSEKNGLKMPDGWT